MYYSRSPIFSTLFIPLYRMCVTFIIFMFYFQSVRNVNATLPVNLSQELFISPQEGAVSHAKTFPRLQPHIYIIYRDNLPPTGGWHNTKNKQGNSVARDLPENTFRVMDVIDLHRQYASYCIGKVCIIQNKPSQRS